MSSSSSSSTTIPTTVTPAFNRHQASQSPQSDHSRSAPLLQSSQPSPQQSEGGLEAAVEEPVDDRIVRSIANADSVYQSDKSNLTTTWTNSVLRIISSEQLSLMVGDYQSVFSSFRVTIHLFSYHIGIAPHRKRFAPRKKKQPACSLCAY
jgi:hypothetical protein